MTVIMEFAELFSPSHCLCLKGHLKAPKAPHAVLSEDDSNSDSFGLLKI